MQKHSDETLVAYLDGELDGAERQHVEAWLAADHAARDRLTGLAQSADLLRSAFPLCTAPDHRDLMRHRGKHDPWSDVKHAEER